MALPNFFIAGAPNAGTTSLYFYLRQHPQVFMSPTKEPTYFGAAEFYAMRFEDAGGHPAFPHWTSLERMVRRTPRAPTWDEYLRLFRGVRGETAIGEASVRYLLLPAAARAIVGRVPGARLIFILRDPAAILFARYLRIAWRDPQRSFRSWFLASVDAGAPWLTVAHYATHLQRFFDVFPKEQLQIHVYEDYCADAGAIVRSIFSFLDVDPAHPIDLSDRYNRTVVPRFAVLETLRRRVLGGIPVTAWLGGGARAVARRIFYRRPSQARVMEPADRALVRDLYRPEIRRTADLLDRDLSAWLS